MNLVISFGSDGTGRCLYSELIDLSAVGPLQITRASRIEFNNQKQRWEVLNLKDRVLFFSRSRAVCLAWEQNNLQ
jgi:hypothetical protein